MASNLKNRKKARSRNSPSRRQERSSTSTYSDVALQYALDVVDSEIVACKWVKLACRRHLDDLKRSRSREFLYRYDEAKANLVCEFIELLPHVKGKWANASETIKLQPWQVFCVCSLFGWVNKQSGKYRFRTAYIEVPRKNGKSILAAAIGLYKFAADGEFGAEVYSGATTEEQAWEVFRPAHEMVSATPALKSEFGITTPKKSLLILSKRCRFRPLIGKPGDGASPSCAIVDEYHEHQTDEFYETMRTGMAARENPLLFVITTAGDDLAGPCYAMHQDCKKVLEGMLENEELFAIIYTIDEGDDWKSVESLKKTNPNYGVSVLEDIILGDLRDAINTTRKQNSFKTKHENIWCNTASGWMNMEWWNRCADHKLNIADFKDTPCIEAFDLASRIDIASRVKVFRRVSSTNDPSKDHFYVFARHYMNAAKIEQNKGSHYEAWANAGVLVKTPGSITDYKLIADEIISDALTYKPREIPLDMRDSGGIISFVQGDDRWDQKVQFVEIAQTVAMLSPPMKEIEAIVLDGRLHFNGDPVLTWMISNVVCREDNNGNIFPRKQREDNKIDGAVALIMCMNRWMAAPREAPRSVYSKRGIRRL